MLVIVLGAGAVMVFSLAWVSNFFSRGEEGTPVIWIQGQGQGGQVDEEEPFAEWDDQ
jgi:hypothetical protein